MIKKEEIDQKRNGYKLSLLEELLSCVNAICSKEKLSYVALEELLSLHLAGTDSNMNRFDYKIALLTDDYLKLIDELEKKYRTAKSGIRFDLKAYFKYEAKDPVLSLKRSFQEEVGSKDVKVNLHIQQLSYLPAQRKQREKYFTKVSESYRSMHAKIVWSNEVLSQYIKSAKIDVDKDDLSPQLQKMRRILTKYKNTPFVAKVEQSIGNIMKSEDLYPVRKVSFLNTELMIPQKAERFRYRNPSKINEELQVHRLKTLERFDAFCMKNHLDYFVAKDLLVQIMTEGRFPKSRPSKWAIGMLREDYEKALSLLRSADSAEGIVLSEHKEGFPNIPGLSTNIMLEEDSTFSVSGRTATIDLLPYDKLTSSYEESILYKEKIEDLLDEYERCVQKSLGLPLSTEESVSMKDTLKKIKDWETCYDQKTGTEKVFQGLTAPAKNIPINEIFPLQRKKWHGIEISLPYNPYIWTSAKDEGYTEYLVEGKTKILGILDRICKEQNLPYFATESLLIGTYIYHDTIPYSGMQNFSIGLVRENYEALLEFLRQHGNEYGIQLNEYRDDAGKYPTITKFVTFIGRESWHILIRLHPYDKVPASFYLRKAFLETIKEWNNEYKELVYFHEHKEDKLDNLYSEQDLEELRKKYREMDPQKLADQIDQYAQKYNDDPQAAGYQRVAFAASGKVVSIDSIRHTERLKFRDIYLECPGDISPWYQPMDEELSYQIKTLQRENRRLLKEFDRVCQEMGIGYFLCAGTLLGYVRNDGFIPWDDDVDVGMLREDYDKLLAHGQEYFGEEFFLQTRESDRNIPYVYSKLRLNDTEYFTEYTKDRDMHKGIGMDIFPFDYVPNEMKKREKFVREVTKLSKAHNVRARNQYPKISTPFPPRNEEEARIEKEQKDIIADYWRLSLKDSQQAYLDEATKFNSVAQEKKLKTVASFVIGYTCINVEDLLPYQRTEFEGIEVSIPKYPHALMKMQYGNYMQLPPLHQRLSHKVVKWSVGEDGSDRLSGVQTEKNAIGGKS